MGRYNRNDISPSEKARLKREADRKAEREAKKQETKRERAQAKADKEERFRKQHATRRKEGAKEMASYKKKRKGLRKSDMRSRTSRIASLEDKIEGSTTAKDIKSATKRALSKRKETQRKTEKGSKAPTEPQKTNAIRRQRTGKGSKASRYDENIDALPLSDDLKRATKAVGRISRRKAGMEAEVPSDKKKKIIPEKKKPRLKKEEESDISKATKQSIKELDSLDRNKKKLAKLKKEEAIAKSKAKTKSRLQEKGEIGLTDVVGEESDYAHQKELKRTVAKVASRYGKTEKQFLADRAEGGANYTDEEKADFDAEYSRQIGGELGETAVSAGPELQRTVEAKRIADRKVFQDQVTDDEVAGIKNTLNESVGDGKTKADVMEEEGFGDLASPLADGKIDEAELREAQDKFNDRGTEKLDGIKYDSDTGSWIASITNNETNETRPVKITEGSLRAWNEVKGKKIEDERAIKMDEAKASIALDKKAREAGDAKLKSLKDKLSKLMTGATKNRTASSEKKIELLKTQISTYKDQLVNRQRTVDNFNEIKTSISKMKESVKDDSLLDNKSIDSYLSDNEVYLNLLKKREEAAGRYRATQKVQKELDEAQYKLITTTKDILDNMGRSMTVDEMTLDQKKVALSLMNQIDSLEKDK